jgi:hypothetical protein
MRLARRLDRQRQRVLPSKAVVLLLLMRGERVGTEVTTR